MAKIDLNKQAQEILVAAQNSGAEQNFLFVTTFKRYQVQLKILNDLELELRKNEALGNGETGESGSANHAIKAYNQSVDSANRTAATLMKVITSLKDVGLDDGDHEEM